MKQSLPIKPFLKVFIIKVQCLLICLYDCRPLLVGGLSKLVNIIFLFVLSEENNGIKRALGNYQNVKFLKII